MTAKLVVKGSVRSGTEGVVVGLLVSCKDQGNTSTKSKHAQHKNDP